MAKKEYRVEINNPTAENIAKLKEAGVEFTLYEANEVKKESDSFAGGSNFATTQIILRPAIEIDTTEYEEQALKNYCAGLQRNLYGKSMEKVVKL